MTQIINPQSALTFGALNLMGSAGTPYWFEALADGSDFGNPVANMRAILSFLQDGSIEAIDNFGNRETPLVITVCGTTSAALAAGEAALAAEAWKRNTLTYTPPEVGGLGVACVFDVVTSTLEYTTDDFSNNRLERTYRLTVKALPFAKPVSPTSVVSAAPPNVSPTVTLIDNCQATTGWAASSGSPSVWNGTGVRATYTYVSGPPTGHGITLTRPGLSVNLATAQYVRIDLTSTKSGPSEPGVTRTALAVTAAASGAHGRWYLNAAAVRP